MNLNNITFWLRAPSHATEEELNNRVYTYGVSEAHNCPGALGRNWYSPNASGHYYGLFGKSDCTFHDSLVATYGISTIKICLGATV
jgi:hypothetical protein